MPIYEYKCKDCGAHVERRQKVSDDPLKTCESCGGAMEKQWSRTGFQFKGEGWYVTDYSAKKGDPGKPAEKSDAGESTAKAEPASKPKTDGGSDAAK